MGRRVFRAVVLVLMAASAMLWVPRQTAGAWSTSDGAVAVFGSEDSVTVRSVAVDSSGNVYTTGHFQGTVDFDPGSGTANLTAAGEEAAFVSKLDSSGNYVWAKHFVSSYRVKGESVAVDASGNVYTTGYFSGTADFDPGEGTANLTTNGSVDVFVWKLDSSGNLAGSGGASAGVTVSKTSASVTEAGGTDSFTVVLDAQPTSNVVIDVASPDTGEATQPAVQ